MSNLKQYFKEKGYNPSDITDVVKAYADAKINKGANQEDVAKAVGISARTLRKYVAEQRDQFDGFVVEFELKASGTVPSISENDLDAFVNNLLRMGTNPSSAKELQLFIEFFGITATDVQDVLSLKRKSLRGWLRESSSNFDFIDVKEMQKALHSMDILYNQNTQSVGATALAGEIDINNPMDQYRLMYLGTLFVSLYNQSDSSGELLEYLSTLMRVEQLKAGRDIPIDRDINKQIEKTAGTYKEPNVSDADIKELLGLSEAELRRYRNMPSKKPVELPEREIVAKHKQDYKKELRGYLKPSEELELMLKGEL